MLIRDGKGMQGQCVACWRALLPAAVVCDTQWQHLCLVTVNVQRIYQSPHHLSWLFASCWFNIHNHMGRTLTQQPTKIMPLGPSVPCHAVRHSPQAGACMSPPGGQPLRQVSANIPQHLCDPVTTSARLLTRCDGWAQRQAATSSQWRPLASETWCNRHAGATGTTHALSPARASMIGNTRTKQRCPRALQHLQSTTAHSDRFLVTVPHTVLIH